MHRVNWAIVDVVVRRHPQISRADDICFGAPRIEGRVPTEAIADRYVAGDSLKELACQFEIAFSQVEAALRFELDLRQALAPCYGDDNG